MANENERPRAGGRTAAIGGRCAAGWSGALGGDFFSAIRQKIANAMHAEAESARLAPWLPVCFGIGILFYFAAPQEPSFAVAASAFIFLAAIVFISRERPAAFAVSLALAAAAAGFSIGALRGHLVAHPTLTRATQTVVLTGFVESRDATDRSDRVVLRLTSASGRGAEHLSKRVRVSLRHGAAPNVGSHVEVKARMRR